MCERERARGKDIESEREGNREKENGRKRK